MRKTQIICKPDQNKAALFTYAEHRCSIPLMKTLTVIFFLLLFGISVIAQDNQPKPNQWKGLILDKSTADDVIKKFGKADKDKKDDIRILDLNKLFTEKLKKGEFRVIRYKKVDLAKDVSFTFDESNILILIEFKPQDKLPVQSFLQAYPDIEFQPSIPVILGITSQNSYILQAKTDSSFVLSMVTTSALASIFGKTGNVEINRQTQSNNTLSGNIWMVQLVSKTLTNTKNQDVLK
jgi:hypothetical protein